VHRNKLIYLKKFTLKFIYLLVRAAYALRVLEGKRNKRHVLRGSYNYLVNFYRATCNRIGIFIRCVRENAISTISVILSSFYI